MRLITLNVYSANQIAQGLYQKLGFKAGGQYPGAILYHGKYIHEIHMYLKLN